MALDKVRLRRSRADLYVELLNDDGNALDYLMVDNHLTDDSGKVESIHVGNKVLQENQYQALIDEMAAFTAGDSRFADLGALQSHFWREEGTVLGTPSG